MYQRYAIFFTPQAGSFADFGAAWLGWDSAAGKAVAQPQFSGVDMDALTGTPRKYGFHATLKAPFYAAEGVTDKTLRLAVERFAATHSARDLGRLEVSTQGGFLSLRPMGDPTALRALAGSIVRDLDPLRAPLSNQDIARRRRARLTPQQDQQMLDWGYPYVFDDFNFHMTLSGRIKRDAVDDVVSQVQPAVLDALPASVVLDALTLMGQDQDGMFHQLHRVPFSD